jgi:hypothetical protein
MDMEILRDRIDVLETIVRSNKPFYESLLSKGTIGIV